MPFYTSKGKIYNIPDDRVNDFLSKRKDAKQSTNKELSDFENKRANLQASTPRESNIIKDSSNQSAIFQGNNTLVPTIPQNKPNLTVGSPGILPLSKSQSLNKTIENVGERSRNARTQDSDYIVGSALDDYQSYNKWIDDINKDPNLSDNVKQELNQWYKTNIRDTDNSTDDVRIPSLVREYLDNNKQNVETGTYVSGGMFSPGQYVSGITQKNTPEQLALAADFLINSPKGRMIQEDEKQYLLMLDNNIDNLEKDITASRNKRNELFPKSIGMRNYLRMSSSEKEKFNKERDTERSKIDKQFPYSDITNAENQLNELKKLREAYKDGDKNKIKQFTKEFGRRLPYDLVNAVSFGGIGLADQSGLSNALENPNNKLTRQAYDLLGEYQQVHELDRSIAQDIAQGTSNMLPFVAQFASSEGLVSAATKLPKMANLGKGMQFALKASETLQRPLLRMAITPQLLTEAYKNNIDNPGTFLDAFAQAVPSTYIEFFTEDLGRYIPEPMPKNKTVRALMERTGVQGSIGEMAEEEIGMLLQPLADGSYDWSEFVNPRNQIVTAGTIAAMQIPYASIAAGGYAAGKAKNIKQKRSIRKGYNSNLANMNNVFGDESSELINTINELIDSDGRDGINIDGLLNDIVNDNELNNQEKDASFKYALSYIAMSSLNQSKQEDVAQVTQQVTQAVEENTNPEMNAVVSATIAGVEGPMQVVSGNIVQREDGSIDREASDKQIFYTDEEGNRQVTSIDFVENIEENIPTQDAIAQLTEAETANIISQQENEEVREYTPGEIVTADIYGNGVPFTGQITEVTEEGNYIIVGTQSGQRAEIQPRQIINQDNIQGVDNGSLVNYRNEKGEIIQGVVNDAYGLRPQGMMDIDGNVIPIVDVIGLVVEEEQLPPPPADMMIGENGAVPYNPNVSNSQYSTQGAQQNEQSVTTSPSEHNNLSYIEQIPQNESGSLLFEQVPVETTIGALNEVYNDAAELSGVVDATISNIGKQIDKAKSPKPTGDITKDIANKQKANQQIEELNNRLSYWQDVRNSIQQSRPIEQRVTEQLTGELTANNQQLSVSDNKQSVTNKKSTPFQRRLNAVEENVHTIRDRILFGIASGAYKFRWKDKGVSMGLARELGLSGSEAERKARIGLLSNNGFTPSTLAHRIWEETGGELNDNDIRSEVIDVLNSVSSRKQALETLENNAGITEEQYQQQQTEASEYELKLRAQEEANLLAIIEQQSNETLLSLEEEALSLGATSEQLQDVQTSTDFIDLIEQLQDGQQEQTSNEGRSETETSNNNSEGNETDSTQRAVSERSRSEESTGDSRQDSDSTGNGINLSPEEQRVVDEATAQIDAEIAEAQKELTTQQKELSSARKRLGKAQADTQGNLFGSEQQSTLFDVPADLSKENAVDNILSPIQQQIDAAQTNLDTLTNSRGTHIQEALDNYRKQGNLLDEIARAEAETDTNPTEAQKEAGNYKKGKVTIQGFNISIEQPQGSVRSGVDANGKEWSITMNNTYGYIRGTEGKDRDHIDVFLGNNPESNRVFVVDQVNQDRSFDEHKVMLGFDSIEEAREAYLSNYEEGWQGLGNITEVDVDTFRKWTDSETRRIKPFAEYKEIQNAESTPESSNDIRIVEYSDKSIAVFGNTIPIKDKLSELKGKYNKYLKYEDGKRPGWIFPKSKESDVRALIEEQSTAPIISEAEVYTPAYGESNTLISSETYEELRKRMRDKLNNLNSGFDPELFTIGTQMAMYHIEAGARKFADFANRMIDDLGDNVRPYLKSFYEGARQMPSMETMRSEMDAYNAVDSFNLDNLSTFENETTKPNSNETNSDNRSDNSIAENGGISTRATDADVRERTASTQTDGRTQSEQRPAMETEDVEQRSRSDRDRGNNAEPSGTELHSRGTERNADNRRKDTGDTEQSGKPLNTNNNRQSREENVVPRGNTAKINANIAAIKLAKRLIETGKKATPEQMSVLRRYTGWGGLSSVFQTNDKNYKALQDLLTEEEYDSARASTTTAFYTPSEVTASVWDMIEKLGFKGGNILEPSAGIGNFFALMPENISSVSRLRGVELDTVSGSILKLLYPDANINISGFEKQRIANNSMDLVVSNVPFGNFKVYDSNNKDISTQFDIHDYFIAKSVRTLKAGGIGVFITTSSTLDKSSALRNWLINNGNADFIDAVRLNTDTFKNDAGTEATADIIIVRKRDVNGISPYAKNMQDSVMEREATYTQQEKNQWGYNTGEVEKKARMVYNKYFLDNPMRMAGEMKFGFEGGNAIRPTEQRLAPVKAINQQEVINQMIDELPSNIYNTIPADKTSKAVANNGTKEGGLTIIDGQPYIVQYNEAVPVDWNSNKAAGYPKEEVLQDYLEIKSTISELLEAESSTDNELVYINKTRTKLNKVYDNFVKKYGNLNENRKINFLQDDIDFPSVAAIENIEDGKDGVKTISKSDIFTKRVIDNQIEPKADNVEDAVRVSMNQNGKVDIPYIAQLLDKTNEEVQSEIVSKRIGFVNPETGLVEARNQYLSGNVRDKLSIAQQANQENEYDSNIEELSKVIPADIPINLIKLTLGSTWVPTNVYEDFFKETFDVGAQFTKTSTDKYIGKFSRKDNAKDIQMGMPEASGSTLALNSMNNATTTISMQVWEDGKRKTVSDPLKTAQAAAKQSEIAETFEAWVKQNKKYHEELENIYNNTFNAVVNSTVDVDSFDRFPGVGGKVVSLGSKELENGKELHQYRVAKENTEADNELVAKEAKSLGLDYNAETGVYSTTNRGNADTFAKKLNGTAKILRQHQKEGVIRGLESATLLAHEVGTGKTLTLITTAMEMRRLGLAKKPTIVVQRSTYKQFVKEIKNQYPNAKVLAPSAKDLTAKQREQLFAKIAYNDWDIVVLYHSYLDSIPDNPQRVAQYIDEKIQEKMDLLAEMERAKEDGAANAGRMMGALKKEIERLERDRDNTLNPEIEEESDTPTKSKRKRSVKDIEKVRSNAEAKAEKSLDRRTDNTMTFEQLGIDALLIDEAHAYKKLGFVTSLQRVKGIDTAESKRAQSTRLKSSYILENHNGKNIVLATGTPISNTMAEMWTFMRYLYPRTEMGRLQMNNFDAFVNNFGSIEESAEFGSNGKFRITNRFSSYSNVPELIAAWRQVAHTVLTEEVSTLKEGVGTPRVEGGKPADIMLEQTPPLKSVMKAIKNKLEEFDRMSGAEKKENSYIPLVMFGLAKRAAIDVRLVDPNLPDHPDSKLNRTVAEVVQDLKNTQNYKGTIAIFCDSYQSSDKTFNVFRELKQKLVDSGIPAEQVAIINDFDKDEAKERLFTSVNNGDVRVVMGTTEKLGVGVNIQERLHMAVHMDAPLRPSDYQQRNGRIMRQGNTHLNMDKTIKILRIGVQKTLDVTGYQRLEIKKKFIDQIMKGDVSQRMLEETDIESTDSSNFNQMMANLSGSQAALALSIEQNKLKKLQNARQYHADNQVFMAGAVRRAKGIIVGNGQAIERFEDYKKELNKLFPEGKVTTVSIGKVSANTPEDIDALLSKHITKRIDKEAADLREDFLRENAIIKTLMLINGIKIDLEIEVKRNYDVDTKKTRVTREIQYTTPNNSIENPHSTKNEVIPLFESKAGANVQNVLDDINDLLSGYDIEREIQRYKIGIDKAQRDIDAYEPQIGQPFAKENELKATEEKVEDLNAQMEVELKQIEEAESKEDVEAIDIDGIVEKNTDDNPEDDPTPPSGGRRQTSSSGNFQSIPAEKFDRLVDKLTQTGLAVDVVLNEDIRNNPELQDTEGNVYGYVTPEGVVHLDATRMNVNTPIHEFGHLWNSFTKENDTALYNRGVELIKQSPYWERVNNNTDYASLSEEQRADEALAMAIGDKGEAITNRSLKQQFVDWLSEVWQSIKRAFGINTNVSLADMTLSDFTDRAVQDLLRGERLTDTSVQSEEKRMQSVNDLADATNSTMTEEARTELDRKLKRFGHRIREAYEDKYLAVKEFQDILSKHGTKIEDYNDFHLKATHISGMNDAQLEVYRNLYQKPLTQSISDLKRAGFNNRNIENYAILKHGLERNEWMRQDAINQYKANNPEATQEQIDKYAESLPDDYAGVTAVQVEIGMSAEDYISEFENKAGKSLINNFWKRVKDATQFSLNKQLEGGFIDKKKFDELTSRYGYYIPLRGHDDIVAEDLWEYGADMGTYFANPIIKANGRRSRAEKPFAYITQMAQSAINASNRNTLSHIILRLAKKDKSGLMNVSESWYEMKGLDENGTPIYEKQSPEYSENPEQYRKNIEEFEERMQKLAEQGFAQKNNGKLDIGGLFIKPSQATQHEVHVWQNGKEYTVYINANPAVARAINGSNVVHAGDGFNKVATASRWMAANFTTRNPLFVATNFSRDYIFASSILPVKENAKYAVQFQLNIKRSAGALQRYIRGKADLSKKQDQYLIEYIMNGAKTGFSHIMELKQVQKQIELDIKNGNKKNAYQSLLSVLSGMNDFAENLSRLSVYITSREQGRSITQSISDAKEVTVNFNRSGSGAMGAKYFRGLYLFMNAGIQALSNFIKVAKKNKGKAALLMSIYGATGFLFPFLSLLIGGDDGLEEYMKLSDWERQSNFCIYTPWGMIKIPLPHELRVFHKMGDEIYQTIYNSKDITETIFDVAAGFTDLIPSNPLGATAASLDDFKNKGLKESTTTAFSMLSPDSFKPFAQLIANKNFMGGKIVNEWADPNKPGYLKIKTNKKGNPYAPAFLVKLGEYMDSATGGDGVEKGLVSFNPDVVDHLLKGYFGGLYNIGMNTLEIGNKAYESVSERENKFEYKDFIPKAFYKSLDDLPINNSGLNSKYFKIADDIQETRRKIKGYSEQIIKGKLSGDEAQLKINKIVPNVEQYMQTNALMKQIKKYESALKDLDGEDRKEAERIIADMKKQVIEINSIK